MPTAFASPRSTTSITFATLIASANRANASFYTVDPRGLVVFDSPIGPEAFPRLEVDQANLRNRLDSLDVLANNTDGFAVVNSNDLDKGLSGSLTI